MSAAHVLVVMDKATDLINPRISPEHAGWNLQLREARAAVAELIDQRAELIARLEQVVPYLYTLENEGIDTCIPVRMKIEQAEAALARCKGET